MNPQFDRDEYPGRPRILFIGQASSHTDSWISLLDGARFNIRFFAVQESDPPRDDWPVRTYVSRYRTTRLDSETRRSLYPQGAIKFGVSLMRHALHRASAPPEEAWLARVIQSWRPDIIHTLGLEPAAYVYMNARRRGGLESIGTWVAQVRGGPELVWRQHMADYRAKLQAIFATCDQLIADNRQNYEYAAKLGLSDDRVSPLGVVPGTGGIDVDRMLAAGREPPSRRRTVLWPKAYECPPSKALPVFEALKLAWDRMPACEMYLTAMSPDMEVRFMHLPERIKKVCHTAARLPRERTLELMTESRVMLAPSLIDGVPNTMLEAMASRTFPIVSPVETLVPLVRNEENVLFARNLYPHEIADALVRGMSDDAMVDAAADANLALVRRIGDRATIRPRVVDFYERIVRRGGAARRTRAPLPS